MMETVRVATSFFVTGESDFDQHLDLVMQALMALEASDTRVTDSDYEAVLSTGFVRINSTATAPTFDEATAIAMATIRSAIHTAGGFTPGWESANAELSGTETTQYKFVEQQLIKW